MAILVYKKIFCFHFWVVTMLAVLHYLNGNQVTGTPLFILLYTLY